MDQRTKTYYANLVTTGDLTGYWEKVEAQTSLRARILASETAPLTHCVQRVVRPDELKKLNRGAYNLAVGRPPKVGPR